MAREKKKWVAFRTASIIPGKVLGEDKDRKMAIGAPVQLPASYADHVIHDGFAYACDAPKKVATDQKTDDRAQALSTAKTKVDDLKAKLAEMPENADGRETLVQDLEATEAALTELTSAS